MSDIPMLRLTLNALSRLRVAHSSTPVSIVGLKTTPYRGKLMSSYERERATISGKELEEARYQGITQISELKSTFGNTYCTHRVALSDRAASESTLADAILVQAHEWIQLEAGRSGGQVLKSCDSRFHTSTYRTENHSSTWRKGKQINPHLKIRLLRPIADLLLAIGEVASSLRR